MYSVISFVPSDRAKSNEKGHFGYTSVKGVFENKKDAEIFAESVYDLSKGTDIISVVFGNQYIPCMDYDCLETDFKESELNNNNDFLINQLNINKSILEQLKNNIEFLNNIKIIPNILKYSDEENKDIKENNIEEMKDLTFTQENLNKGIHKRTGFKKLKYKINKFLSKN